jgi:hypothetical protein
MTSPTDPDDKIGRLCGTEKLKDAGFRLIGAFAAEEGNVGYVLHDPPNGSQVLYAFVLDGYDIAFIGRTVRGLVTDIASHFSTGPAVSHGRQCDWLITKSLEEGRTIEIYALPEDGHLMMRGFIVNLGAAILDSVIAEFEPWWNFLVSDWDPDWSGSAHGEDEARE